MKRTLGIFLSILLIIAIGVTTLGFAAIPLKSIKLNANNISLQLGNTYQLKVSFTPANTTQKRLIFKSADNKIATVDKNGLVKAIKSGKTYITVTSVSNIKVVQKCNVLVFNKTSNNIDISKAATLRMLLLGDRPKEYDLMLIELNKLLKKDLNAKLSVTWLPIANRYDKMRLILMSGEDYDITLSSTWAAGGFADIAKKKALYPITNEALAKYMPAAKMTVPEEIWKDASVNGTIYAAPMNFALANGYGVLVRGDLMQKYGIKSIDSMEDWAKYADAVLTNEKELRPVILAANDANLYALEVNGMYGQNAVGSLLAFDYDYYFGGKMSFKSQFEDEKFIKSYKKAREFFLKGYWNKDALNNKTTSIDSFKNGLAASAFTLLNIVNMNYKQINTEHPNWNVKFYPIMRNDYFKRYNYAEYQMLSIVASSRNPERALMFLDKLYSSEDYFMMLMYGVKNRHWEITADNKVRVPEGKDPTLFPPWVCPWGVGNGKDFIRSSMDDYPDRVKILKLFDKNAKPSPLAGFFIDDNNIKAEIAAIKNLNDSYLALYYGYMDNVDDVIKKALAEAKEIGLDKLKAEVQKQVDAFMSAKK